MIVIDVRNVIDALYWGVCNLVMEGKRRASRNGDTLECPETVATVYQRPRERVLFCPVRDANPFLHFFEALWMLAGRNDVGFLSKFAPRMREFSDDGQRLHGAYGFRWREHFAYDQLEEVVKLLRRDPTTRRAVLAMWDANIDAGPGAPAKPKDLPCNTTIYFKVRDDQLYMTVCNRSNDIVWGAYGANAVHFSMLHEYVADKVQRDVGLYTQISDSFHAYLPPHAGGPLWEKLRAQYGESKPLNPYRDGAVDHFPINAGAPGWDEDLEEFFNVFDQGFTDTAYVKVGVSFRTEFFRSVVLPMWNTFETRDLDVAASIAAPDWRLAVIEWLKRRIK